jgi:AcrR family transcriptional regulator
LREVAIASPAEPEALFTKLKPGPGRSADAVAGHQRARIVRAMTELTADRGYAAVTARELTKVAGISTKSFYEHFPNKEECFLATHETIARRIVRGVAASQIGAGERDERVRLAFRALTRELASDPPAAQLLLIEAYAAGPAALAQARRAIRSIEARVEEGFRGAGDQPPAPLIVEGIVAGVAGVARARLLGGGAERLADLGDPLSDWALSYRHGTLPELTELMRLDSPCLDSPLPSLAPSSSMVDEEAEEVPYGGDLDLLLSAVAKLTAAEGYEALTVRRILDAAGAPKRSFYSHFSGADECFLAAVDSEVDAVVRSIESAAPQPGLAGACRTIAALCSAIAGDQAFSNLCFAELLSPGGAGARACERLTARLVELLGLSGELSPGESDVAAEASVGAVWGVLHNEAVAGRARAVPQIARVLAYLVLAPSFGAAETADAIRHHFCT